MRTPGWQGFGCVMMLVRLHFCMGSGKLFSVTNVMGNG